MIDAQKIADDGFRHPKATNSPTPPPAMKPRNDVSWYSNELLNASMIRMHVATPRNRKSSVPMLVAIAVRELAYVMPECSPSIAAKQFMTAQPPIRKTNCSFVN